MRLASCLFLVAITLLATCDAATTSGRDQHSVLDPAVGAAQVPIPRALRTSKARDEGEERGLALEQIDDLLARLEIAQANALAALNKVDRGILNKIDDIASANARIQRWKELDWNPIYVANMLRNDYPTVYLYGVEWNAWRLYAAQYLRQYHSLNPTVHGVLIVNIKFQNYFNLEANDAQLYSTVTGRSLNCG